jgi:hypothetical protein
MEARPAPVRAALRVLHTAAPEAAARVEGYLDDVERRCAALSADDPYRALVMDLHATMVRVDSGLLADVARIELARLEHARAEHARHAADAADRLDARGVWKGALSPQVVIAVLTLILGSGGIGGLVARYLIPGATP